MKQEDFERLKAVCEKEGFEVLNQYLEHSDNLFITIKMDIWEGVEFASHYLKGVALIKDIINDVVYFDHTQRIRTTSKKHLEPSTESAYIDQLKKESFQRFGEIKEGDRFENPMGGKDTRCQVADWVYNKQWDWLYYGQCMLYNSCKWATKLPKRIEVEVDVVWNYTKLKRFQFLISESIELDKSHAKFLAQQLEKYLNNEI